MSAPTLSPDQTQALQNARAVAIAGEAGALQAEAGWTAAIAEQEKVDSAFAAFFNYYNNIIRNYELEIRYMTGNDIEEPIIEQDLLDFANETGRLFNASSVENGDYAPERIDEFDGQPKIYIDNFNEDFLISSELTVLDRLVSFPVQNTSFPATAETTSELNDTSTTLGYDSDGTETVNVGDLIYVTDGVNFSIVEVVSLSGSCSDPQYTDQATCESNSGTWTSGIEINIIIPPENPIPMNSSIGQQSYTGFSDTERSNKTANNSSLQIVMDYFLDRLNFLLSERVSVLNALELILQDNDDDNLDPQALINVQDARTDVGTALGNNPPTSIDISNTGIGDLESEANSRSNEVNQRLSDIPTAISNGDFYNLRYQYASSRARLDNGSLRLLEDYEKAREGQQDSRLAASELESRYANILGS